MNSISKGSRGELYAVRYLRNKGYYIITSNFNCRFGEIDIIAKFDSYIVFVEVKTRANNAFVTGRESVTKSKQRKIITSAMIFMSNFEYDLQPRFDVIEIVTKPGEKFEVEELTHFESAFDSEGFNATV